MEADQRGQRPWATLTYNSEPGGWRKCAQTSPWWGRSSWGGIWARWRCRPCPAGCRFLLCSNPPALTGWQTSPRHTGRSSRQCFGSGCGSPARPPWGDKTGHANRQKFFLDGKLLNLSLRSLFFILFVTDSAAEPDACSTYCILCISLLYLSMTHCCELHCVLCHEKTVNTVFLFFFENNKSFSDFFPLIFGPGSFYVHNFGGKTWFAVKL